VEDRAVAQDTHEIDQSDPDCLFVGLIISPERLSRALAVVLHDDPDEVIEVTIGHPLHVEIETSCLGGDLWCPDDIDLLVTNSQSLELTFRTSALDYLRISVGAKWFWGYYLPHEAMFNDQANADELVRFVDGVGHGELGAGRAAYKPAGQPKYPQSLVLKRKMRWSIP
jgi:hypothetical protein